MTGTGSPDRKTRDVQKYKFNFGGDHMLYAGTTRLTATFCNLNVAKNHVLEFCVHSSEKNICSSIKAYHTVKISIFLPF